MQNDALIPWCGVNRQAGKCSGVREGQPMHTLQALVLQVQVVRSDACACSERQRQAPVRHRLHPSTRTQMSAGGDGCNGASSMRWRCACRAGQRQAPKGHHLQTSDIQAYVSGLRPAAQSKESQALPAPFASVSARFHSNWLQPSPPSAHFSTLYSSRPRVQVSKLR